MITYLLLFQLGLIFLICNTVYPSHGIIVKGVGFNVHAGVDLMQLLLKSHKSHAALAIYINFIHIYIFFFGGGKGGVGCNTLN